MGFKTLDLTPLQVTPITPPGKTHLLKVFQVTTADTVGVVKAMLPGSSSVTNIYYHGDNAGDVGSAVALTISNNTGDISSGTLDVETNGTGTGIVDMSNLPNLEPVPMQGDLKITAVTTATTGGPWRFVVEYVA